MADDQAWSEGWQLGKELSQERRAHKQALSDQELEGKINELIDNRKAIQGKLPTLLDEKGNPTRQYNDAIQALTQNARDLREVYHPEQQPGAIQKFGHLLTDALHLTKAEDQNKKAAGDEKTAQGVAAAAPLSSTQAATGDAQAKAAAELAYIQNSLKNWKTLNPNATPEEESAYRADLIQKTQGVSARGSWTNVPGKINGQPTTLLFDKNTHQYRTQSGDAVPTELLDTFVPDVKATADNNKRADFDAFKKQYKEKNGKDYEGTFESWSAEQTGLGRNAAVAAKPPNRDDRYIAIGQKALSGQALTPDDIAYKGAYDLWVQKTKVDPGVARMAALNNDRYTWVYDLNDPDKNLHPMRMGDAAKAPVGSPQNIAFKTDTAITRAFTSGTPATTINYFNTAIEHLKLLQEATDALNNGNIQLFNGYANAWASATGNPAPNNFDTVRNAVSGELSKTFKGTGATDEEIGLISGTINSSQSPDQLYGGIDYDLRLMQGKMDALKGQYEAGKEGKPNFPGAAPPQPPSGSGRPAKTGGSKGSRSLAAAMALPINKGKSEKDVSDHLTQLGYTVTRP